MFYYLADDSESDVSFIQRKAHHYLSLESWGKPGEYWSRGGEQWKMANSGDDVSIKIVQSPLKKELKRQISDASQISTASEVSRLIWNLSNLPSKADHKHSAWGLVDHNGGLLTIADCGISLLVPPMAIPEGRTEAIFIALMKEDGDYPSLTERQSLLSPVVVCGPNGIKFNRPVMLTLPHCAAFPDDNSWNLSGKQMFIFNSIESGVNLRNFQSGWDILSKPYGSEILSSRKNSVSIAL